MRLFPTPKLFAVCFFVPFLLVNCLQANLQTASWHKVESFLGAEVCSIIRKPLKITVYKIKPLLKIPVASEPAPIGPIQPLTPCQMETLQDLLLSDSNFDFSSSKSCLFLGEFAVRIQGVKNIIIVFSPSCNQLSYAVNGQAFLLDYEPSKGQFASLLKQLF